ncbi:MAG: DUF4901 domain-containing protein [Oscillospiraceae bacterium]|nr:DUF4901 domain-containing protein [Oscillospiraceae bacterium]
MKFKRLISAALSVLLAVSAVPCVTAFSEESSSKAEENAETTAMRKAILDVKKRVDIPQSLDKFEYDTKTQYDTVYYQFKWYREEKDEQRDRTYTAESISVEYYKGFIRSYGYYSYESGGSSKPSFAKLSSKDQDELAKKYLYQLNPDLKGNPVIERTSDEMELFGKTVQYRISRKESGIDFNGNYGSITIERDTGKLLDYSLKWWSDAVLPDASKRLSVNDVSDIYASRKPLKAYYDMFVKYEYNEETGERKSIPYVLAVYKPTVGGENEIDAITGKYTALYEDREKFSYTDAYTWNGYDDDAAYEAEYEEEPLDDDEDYLSDAEKEALEKENEYLSYEEALKIIKADEYIVFNKELILKSNNISSYTDDYGVSYPARSLRFEFTSSDETKDNIYLNVTLDAYSGKIISFSKSYYYGDKSKNKNETVLNEKNALAVAKKAAKHFIGDKAGEYRYDNNVYIYENTTEGTFEYTRYVNGLPAVFDNMNVRVDSRGEVLGFNYRYHEIEFPEANLVSEEEAYKKLFEHMKPNLYYTGFTDLQLASHVYLTYEFESNYLINALTGERITNYGEQYYTAEKKSEPQKEVKLYTDIKGHKYEKEITTLFEYGVRITDSEKLDPDGAITIGEFVKLCSKANGRNISGLYPDERKYNEETGRYEYFENPMLKQKLTLGELARIYVYTYANDCFTAAGIEGIYAPPYKNVSQNNPYCGYIAIAKAKGLIADGEEFGYNKTISKGKCLKLFYDYIAADTEKAVWQIVSV